MAATLEPTNLKDSEVYMAEKAEVQEITIDPVAEKKLVRKCDLRVVPVLFVLFFLAFLDRTNIGDYPASFSQAETLIAYCLQATRRSRA